MEPIVPQYIRARDVNFRKSYNKLKRKAQAAYIECDARISLIAVSPDDSRIETYASPPGAAAAMDPLVRFSQAADLMTADITQVNSEDLEALRKSLVGTVASARVQLDARAQE